MTAVALNLGKRWKTRHLGDLTLIFTWLKSGQPATWAPCLVIRPRFNSDERRYPPCVVTQRDSWVWSEEHGDGAHCYRASMAFSEAMGFGADKKRAFKITSLIQSSLDDLHKMPPRPRENIVIGDYFEVDGAGRENQIGEIVANAD